MKKNLPKKVILVSISEAAEILGVSIDTLRRMDRDGKLHAIRPNGKDRYFAIDELEQHKASATMSVSEAAAALGVAPLVLLNIEKQGIISPRRNKQGQREYTKEMVDTVLLSEYFLQQKSSIPSHAAVAALHPELLEEMLHQEKQADDHAQQQVIGTVVAQDRHYINSLRLIQRFFGWAIVCIATIFVLTILTITVFFLMFPEDSAKFFGYNYRLPFEQQSQTLASRAVLGTSDEKPSLFGKLLKPFSKVSLLIVKQVNKETYEKIVPPKEKTISDVNDLFIIDNEGNIVPRANVKLSTTSIQTKQGDLVEYIAEEIDQKISIQLNNASNQITQQIQEAQEGSDQFVVLTDSISTSSIVDGTIESSDLATGSVGTLALTDNAVTADKLADDVKLLGDNVVTSSYIQDGTLSNSDLSDSAAISDTKLSQLTTTNKVAGSAVQLATGGGLTNATGLSLLQTCNDEEVLMWNAAAVAWECSATAAGTGDITSVTAGTGLTGGGNSGAVTLNAVLGTDITNAEVVADTIDFSAISDSLTLDAATSIVAGGATNLSIGNNVTLTTTGTGSIVANSLAAGTYGIDISGNAATVTNGLYTNSSFGGDVSGTYGAIVVANDSHNHTSSTISGLDISDDTNLSASDGITLTGDALTNSDKGSSQNIFKTIAVSGQSNVVTDANSDTLTLIAGSNVTLTTDASTDSITIAATGGGSSYLAGNDLDLNGSTFDLETTIDIVDTINLAGTGTLNGLDAIDVTTESTIESAIDTLGNLTSASSLVTVGTLTGGATGTGFTLNFGTSTLSGNITGSNIDESSLSGIADGSVNNDLTISGGTINSTVIGGSTPAAATFTTLTANSNTVLGDGSGDDSITIRKSGSGNVTFMGYAGCTALETDGSGNLTCGTDDSGGGTATLDSAYENGRTMNLDAGDVVFNMADSTNDYKFVLNNNTNGDIATGLAFTTSVASGTIGTAIDLSDSDIATALALGSNDVTVGGVTLAASELALLDSKTTLVDTDDAVGTAITGTGTLNSGSTSAGFTLNLGASTLVGNIGGNNIDESSLGGLAVSNFASANISQWTNNSGYLSSVDISANTNLSATDGITLTGDALSLSSTTGGNGLTYTNGVLAVGAGTGISVAADSISATLGTSIANSELDNDTLDLDKVADTVTLDGDFTLASNNATSDFKFVLDNASTGDIASLFAVTTTGSGATVATALDLSDTDIVTGIALGSNDFTVGGVTLSASELALLDSGVALSELTDSGTFTAGTVDINGGAIDGATIGANSAAAGTFTTLTANGNTVLGDGSGNDSITLRKNGLGTLTFTGFANCTALETDGSGNVGCGSDDSGGGTASLDTAYDNGQSITVDTADVQLDLSDSTNDYKFTINNNTNGAIATGLAFTTSVASGTFGTAIDLSDADIATALALGSNDVTVGGVTLESTELALLNGKTTLVDTDDAVGTAITGTGTLNSGSTSAGFTLNLGASTLVGNIGGNNIDESSLAGLAVSNFASANISQWTNNAGYLSSVDISANTNLSATDGITLTGDQLTLASTTAGNGLTYTNGVLAVGAGTGISVGADSISATLGTSIDTTEVDADTLTLSDVANSLTLDNNLTFVSDNSTNDYKIVFDNSSGGDVATLLQVTTSGGGASIGTAFDLSDQDIATALALGSNDVTVGGVTIDSSEFARLNGINAAIVDADDAVATAITGTGTLTAGSTGTGFTLDFANSTLSGNITGSNISGVDISSDTNLSSSDGITLTGDALTNSDKGSSQNIFKTIAVSGQNNVVTDANGDTLTLAAGTNISITTNDTTDTITITATDTNTTYSAGNDLDLTGTTFDLETTIDTVDTINLAGTGTLNGVDVIDATTESTIEAAIDSLANLSTLTIGGDTITDFVGTGLSLSGNTLTATLGTSIANTELDNDTVDFDKMSDGLTLDAGTSIALSNFDLTLGNSAGTGTVVVSPNAGGRAALIVNKQGATGDILAASASGTSKFVVSNTGGLAIEGSLSDLSDATLNISEALSVTGALAIAGELSDSAGNLVLNDTVDIGGGNGIRIDSTGTILDINDGTVAINDDLSVSGGDITGGNSDSIDIGEAADATFTFTRNDAGAVTITSADNDANANLVVSAGGTGTLTLGDSGSATTVDGNALNLQTTGAGTDITINAVDQIILTDFANCTALETSSGVLTCGSDDTSAGAGISTIQADNADAVTSATSIDFLGSDFDVADDSGEGDISIDYTNSGITRKNQSETIANDWTFSLAETEDLAINLAVSGTNNGTGETITLTNTSASGNQYGLYIDNAASSGTTESLIVIDNSDGDTAVTNAIQFVDAGGGFTNLFNVAGTAITASEFTIVDSGITLNELTDSGTLTAGTVDINGGAIDGVTIGANSAGSGAFTTISASGAIAANGGITFDNASDTLGAFTAAGTIDMNSNIIANLGSTGTDFTTNGALAITVDGAETALTVDNANQAVSIFVAEDNNGAVFTIADGGVVTATQNINADGGLDVDDTFVVADGGAVSALSISDTNVPLTGASFTFDFNNAADRTFTITNSGGGLGHLAVEGDLTVSGGNITNAITFDAGLTVANAQTISIGGDAIDEFVGTGLTLVSGDLQTTLGTSIANTELDNDTLDFDKINDGMTLDANTAIALAGFDLSLGTNAGNGTVRISPNAGGQAALIINKQGANDIFTASASGTTRLTLSNAGALAITGGFTLAGAIVDSSGNINLNDAVDIAGALTANGTVTLGDNGDTVAINSSDWDIDATGAITGISIDANGSGNSITNIETGDIANGTLDADDLDAATADGTANDEECLTYETSGGGDFEWEDCSDWALDAANGLLRLQNPTLDLLLGGTTSSSAKFAVLNMAGTVNTPTASLSAGVAGGAYLTATGTLQTTANQTLTLGGTTTGNVIINAQGNNFVGIGTSAPAAPLDVRTSLHTGPTASVAANSSYAAMVVNNRSSGDIFTASSAALTRFVIKQNGNVHIGTQSAALSPYKFYVSDYNTSTASAMIENTAGLKANGATGGCTATIACNTGLAIKMGAPGIGATPGNRDRWQVFMNGNGTVLGKIRGNNALNSIAYDTNGGDYAEWFKKANSAETFETGDIICQADNGGVTKCSTTNNKIIGAISDNPGFIGNSSHEDDIHNYVLVGLLGHIKIKVSTANGPINPSDMIAVGETGGIGVKATTTGEVLGRVIEGYDNSEEPGLVMAYVSRSWYDPGVSSLTSSLPDLKASTAGELGLDKLDAKDVTVSNTLSVLGRSTLSDVGITGTVTAGLLTINGLDEDGEASINTTAGPLKLQSTGVNGIDILAGKVTIDPDGNFTTTGAITTKKLNIDNAEVAGASLGEAVLKAGTATITIDTTAVTENSAIFVTPKTKTSLPLSVTSQDAGNGFTVETNTTTPVDIRFNWWIVN